LPVVVPEGVPQAEPAQIDMKRFDSRKMQSPGNSEEDHQ
jgi:hypothetical protein